jgi:hypothetical protein
MHLRKKHCGCKEDQMARSGLRYVFSVAFAVSMGFDGIGHPAGAAELDGAWTNDREMCGKVFTNNGGKLALAQTADFYGSGFVIDGNTIRGKTALCKIKSMRKKGNKIHISASCATDVMISDTQFDLALGADGRLTRSFRGMPEMSMEYFRCDFGH